MVSILVNKKELLDALKQGVAGVSKGKSKIVGADSFTFKDGIVATYNDEVAVSTKIPYPELKGTLTATLFLKLVAKMEDEIDITVNPTNWEIKSGNATIMIVLQASECEGYVEELGLDSKPYSIIPTNFYEALLLCTVSKNKTDYDGIYFSGKHAVSTDLFRMAFFELDREIDKFWVSQKAAQSLKKLDNIVEYRADPNWVHFKLEDDSIHSVRRLPDQMYPFDGMMGVYEQYKAKPEMEIHSYAFPGNIDKVLSKVALLSDSELDNPVVEISFTKKELVLSGKSQMGSMYETMEWGEDYTCSEEFTVMMDSTFLAEAVGKTKEFYFLNRDGGSALVVAGENFLQITKAVRKL